MTTPAAPDDADARVIGGVVTRAVQLAGERGDTLGTEHLLLALTGDDPTTAGDILGRHGMTRSVIEGILDDRLDQRPSD